jgi:hypothetical protein
VEDSNKIYRSPKSELSESYKAFTPKIFKSWIMFFLVASVGGGVFGAVVGGILGGILGASGSSVETIQLVSTVVGLMLSIPISYFAFSWSVNKYIVSQYQNREG